MLQQYSHEGRIDARALRQLIMTVAREYPRAELVTHLLRPLRETAGVRASSA